MLHSTPEVHKIAQAHNYFSGSGTKKKKRGSGFTRVKSRLADPSSRGPGRPHLAESLELKIKDGMVPSTTTFEALVDAFNSCNWAEHIYNEALYYKKSGLLDKAMELFDVTPVSTYIEQNRMSKHSKVQRLCKTGRMILKWCAESTHANNQNIIPFSMAARSVALVARRTAEMTWTESTDIVAKKTAHKIIRGMSARRPEPDFQESRRVFVFVYDQVYRVADNKAKGGKTTAQERVL